MRLFIGMSISAAIVTGLVALAAANDGPATASQPTARSAATGVSVILKEFKLVPSPSSVHSGKATFTVKNKGRLPHEFVVIRTATKAGKLPVKGSKASEKGRSPRSATSAQARRSGSLSASRPGTTR